MLKRQGSAKELNHNSSINNSGLLDSEEFVMSNTSMSLHTMSQVQGIDTDRGNILKDSGITLQEDSTLLNDVDDPKISMGFQHHEVLKRQVRPDYNDETP